MKSKAKIEYLVEWRAVWPEFSWEPDGRFTDAAKMKKRVKAIVEGGDKVRITKIVSESTVITPKGWKNSLE